MRATVNRRFYDKGKHSLHEAGETVTLTAERLQELSAKGYVTELPEETTPAKEDKTGAERQTKEEKRARRTK